jgi:hypothetical protein
LFAALLGLVALFGSFHTSVFIFSAISLLGAAAAMILSFLGGANISPAHFLLIFFILKVAMSPATLTQASRNALFPNPGFWLVMATAYALVLTYVAPRLFAGATYVFVPVRSDDGQTGVTSIPLGPTSSNLTQMVYLVGDLLCFLVFSAIGSRPSMARTLAQVGLFIGALNICFAILDLVTYYTNTAELLSFMRNTTYRMLDDVETAGLKRIVGSFTEASSFASVTLGMTAFNMRLWRSGVFPFWTGTVTIISCILIALATSSTGYVGAGVFLSLQFAISAVQLLAGRANRRTVLFVCLLPLAVMVALSILALSPAASAFTSSFIDTTLLNKMSSDSGIERGAWNDQALVAFRDTYWIGAGIGSLRASSWLIAVPANVGVFGAILYFGFVAAVLTKKPASDSRFEAAVRAAFQDACLAALIAACLAASFVDLGLGFFSSAGFACSDFSRREPASSS